MSFLMLGTVAWQRGRAPQLFFIRSRTRSAVVLLSTVTGLSTGTSGGFTEPHSVVMSLAPAGIAASAATAVIRAVQQDSRLAWFMTFLPLRRGAAGAIVYRRLACER